MALNSKKFKHSINIQPGSATSLSEKGDIGYDDSLSAIVVHDGINGYETVLTNGNNVQIGNKTIDADQNDIFNLDDTSIKTGAAIDASKLADGSVSNAEFQRLNGVTGDIQAQLDAKVDDSEKGANNGVATLDAGGKIPASQLPSTVMEFKGTYNATTNTPALVDGTGDAGDVYLVNVAGTQNFGAGNITFAVGDWVLYSGSIWEKSVNSNSVVSVNGQQGVVVLDTDDVTEGTAQYFTAERAQDAVGTALTDSATIDFTYDDTANTISAAVLPAGVDHDLLLNYVANQHIDHSTIDIVAGAGLTGGGAITGDVTIAMPDVGTAGTYGSSSDTLTVTTDVKGRVSSVVASAISVTSANVSDFTEATQDAVGALVTDTSSVNLTYNDASATLTADVIPAGVDHNALLNYVAAQHVDHSTVSISAGTGMSGGGDISANRTLAVDPANATLVAAAVGDAILVADASDANAVKKVTVQSIIDLAGTGGSPSDITETSFTGANNQAVPVNVTGLVFNPGTIGSFEAFVRVGVSATASLYETFKLTGTNRDNDMLLTVESAGDNSLVNFELTSTGQVQYTSANYAGFTGLSMKFRAITLLW